jgi:hypothetical protein
MGGILQHINCFLQVEIQISKFAYLGNMITMFVNEIKFCQLYSKVDGRHIQLILNALQ